MKMGDSEFEKVLKAGLRLMLTGRKSCNSEAHADGIKCYRKQFLWA